MVGEKGSETGPTVRPFFLPDPFRAPENGGPECGYSDQSPDDLCLPPSPPSSGISLVMASTLNMDFSVHPKPMKNPVQEEIGLIFEELERKYGPRDARLRLADVTFVPMHSTVCCPERDLSIYIDKRFLGDEQWVGVLAHEAVHCLGHVRKAEVTFLEEGVAELFSTDYFSRRFREKALFRSDPRYRVAAGYVKELESRCEGIIQAARATQPALSKISKLELVRLCSTLPEGLASALVSRFYKPSECPADAPL